MIWLAIILAHKKPSLYILVFVPGNPVNTLWFASTVREQAIQRNRINHGIIHICHARTSAFSHCKSNMNVCTRKTNTKTQLGKNSTPVLSGQIHISSDSLTTIITAGGAKRTLVTQKFNLYEDQTITRKMTTRKKKKKKENTELQYAKSCAVVWLGELARQVVTKVGLWP